MNCVLRKMSPQQYREWMQDDRKRDASLPSFFGSGERRTLNVLEGKASEESVSKWRSFGARHGASYCRNPTYRQAIALRNWGYLVKVPKKEVK